MRRTSAIFSLTFFVSVTAVAVFGCSSYTATIPNYAPSRSSIPSDSGPVAVYLFDDKRGADKSKRIGGVYRPLREPARFLYGSEPTAFTVTRGFAEGLRAGGVSVVDLTQTPFVPTTMRKETPIALTGEVQKFWTEAQFGLSGYPGYRFTFSAECSVLMQVYISGGSKAWGKVYSKKSADSSLRRPDFDAIAAESVNRLARLLTETVEEVVNDPEFVHAIGRQRP